MIKGEKWISNKLGGASLVPKISRITSLRYFQALRNGFFAIMPLTIIDRFLC